MELWINYCIVLYCIANNYKDLWGINKVLLLLNEHGDPSFLFQNLSSSNINNQWAKFDKNLSAGSISVEWPMLIFSFSIVAMSTFYKPF